MVKRSPELLEFLDGFTIDQCKKITPKANLKEIGDNLEVFSFNEGISTVFYLKKYIMTIDWKIIQ